MGRKRDEFVEINGRRFVLVRDTTYCENAILSGEAVLVDVGEERLVYALPVDD